MAYQELDPDLLLLAAEGGDYNLKELVARIEDMTVSERRLLREAIKNLDEALDEAIMAKRVEKIRKDEKKRPT